MSTRLLVLLAITASAAVAHADPATDLPETPSRVDVLAAMSAAAPRIAACAPGARVTVTVSHTFGSEGRVRSATVRHSATDPVISAQIEACIVAAASTAVLPPFRRDSYVVSYPYRL